VIRGIAIGVHKRRWISCFSRQALSQKVSKAATDQVLSHTRLRPLLTPHKTKTVCPCRTHGEIRFLYRVSDGLEGCHKAENTRNTKKQLHPAPQQCALSNFPRSTAFLVEDPFSHDISSIEFSRSRSVRYLDLPETQDLAQRSSFVSTEKIQGDTVAAIPKGDLQRRLQQWQDHWSKRVATCRAALFRC
jgi:hypothetical protein